MELGEGRPLGEVLAVAYDPLNALLGMTPGSLGETSARGGRG
jgi:hypothetical protein